MRFDPSQPLASRSNPIKDATQAAAGDLDVSVARLRGEWKPVLAESSALELTLRALRPLLDEANVTDLCINAPGEAFVASGEGWRREAIPFADFGWCVRLAKLIANATRQRIDTESPLLSASLPSGERIQLAMPPATSTGCVAMAIRRPSNEDWSIEQLARRGIFHKTRRATAALDETEQKLLQLLADGRYLEFMRLAVVSRKNILVSGPTGSGKTTWTRALIREIPAHERLITIEDAQELKLTHHPNHVNLFYSKGDQGQARITAKELLDACLRLWPDRVLLTEVRAEEAFEYVRLINSGHPAITSIHAPSAELAFEQLTLLVKQSSAGRELPPSDIKSLLYRVVDVVIQFGVEGHQRCITEIYFDPHRKRCGVASTA